MNLLGNKYIKDVTRRFSSLPLSVRKTFVQPTNNEIHERCLRLGNEERKYSLNGLEHEEIAYHSLKEDFCNKNRQYERN